MSRLQLFLLGAPRINLDGMPINVDTRKAVALAAYLAMGGRSYTRERLATTFWPEADDVKAHAALRRTLSVLNKALDGVGLKIEREAVELERGPEVWVDVDAFRAATGKGVTHGHTAHDVCPKCLEPLTEAARLYRGDFLDGFSLRDSPEFDDWQFFQSETLRRELANVLERLVKGYSQANNTEAAIATARRWLALDPIHEPAHRQLMMLYDQAGERAAALRQYAECLRILDEELGVPPLAETLAAYEAIRDGRTHREPVARETASISNREQGRSEGLPLVGRGDAWDTLRSAYEAVGTQGRLAVIEGEAGIGKTRLAEAVLEVVRQQGGIPAQARCYEGEATLAYGPFVELLRGALRHTEFIEAVKQLDKHAVAEASRLLPELGEVFETLPAVMPLDSPGAQSRFFEGVVQVVGALANGSKAGVIFLDDVQWMDDASLDLLIYLVRRLSTQRLLVLITWRGEQVPTAHRLRQLLAETQRSGVGQRIGLERLSEAAVTELVQRTLNTANADLTARLYIETEGLPLFVVEYLAVIQREADQREWALPVGVQGLLQSRLSGVSEAGRQLLSAAAVIGRSFDLETLQAASGRSLDESVAGLEGLVGLGIVREVSEGDGSLDHYDFCHDKLRALVYDETSLTRRRLLHRRTAEALALRARGPQTNAGLISQIAQQYRLSGQRTEAAHYYKLAGDYARALFANVDALAHYQRAMELGYGDVAGLYEAIGDLQTLRGDYASALKSYENASSLASIDGLAVLEHKLGIVYERRGDGELAGRHFEAALAAFGENEAGGRARVLADWSLTAHYANEPERAQLLAEQSLGLAEAVGDARALAQVNNILGILATHQEDFSAARGYLEQSLALAVELSDVGAQVAALNNLALGYKADDKWNDAVELTTRALRLCESQGDKHREAALHNNLADLLHSAGRGDEAMAHLKRAVALFAEIGVTGDELVWQPEIWKLTEW